MTLGNQDDRIRASGKSPRVMDEGNSLKALAGMYSSTVHGSYVLCLDPTGKINGLVLKNLAAKSVRGG
jgi:hypothetical protein